MFQYIICVGSREAVVNKSKIIAVSIHHMCRFKKSKYGEKVSSNTVSIHHMCRFKLALNTDKALQKQVSIHHMCRFKK